MADPCFPLPWHREGWERVCGVVGFLTWGLLSGCLDCQLAGKEPAAGQDGERHRGITQLPASSQGLGEAGLEAVPRQLVRMLPFGVSLAFQDGPFAL